MGGGGNHNFCWKNYLFLFFLLFQWKKKLFKEAPPLLCRNILLITKTSLNIACKSTQLTLHGLSLLYLLRRYVGIHAQVTTSDDTLICKCRRRIGWQQVANVTPSTCIYKKWLWYHNPPLRGRGGVTTLWYVPPKTTTFFHVAPKNFKQSKFTIRSTWKKKVSQDNKVFSDDIRTNLTLPTLASLVKGWLKFIK